ncbi:MAG: ATP-binding protein [Campylobacterales bacterium]
MPSVIPAVKNRFSMRLSTRVALLFASLFLLSLAAVTLLAYRSATAAVSQEIARAFEQRHGTVAHLISGRLQVLDAHLSDAARNPLFFKALKQGRAAEEELLFLLDSPAGQHLDLLFALDEAGGLILDVGSPLFPVDRLLPAIKGAKRDFLQGWRLVHTPELTAIVKALAMIDPATGRVEGYLFGGVSLSKNPPLMRFLMQESGVSHIAFLHEEIVVASHPGIRSVPELGAAAIAHEENLYFSKAPLMLWSRPSGVSILLAIDDGSYERLKETYLFNFLWVTLLLLPLFGAAVFLIHRSTDRGVRHLVDYARAVEQGLGKNAVYAPTGVAEYDTLGESFGKMVQTLGEQQQTIQKLFDGAAGPIIVWDARMVITRINKAAAAFFSQEISGALGLAATELFANARPSSIAEVLRRSTTSAEGFYELECSHFDPHGGQKQVIWSITPVGDGSRVVAVIAQGQEITRLKEAERALTQAKDAAEAASLAKSRFLANMSHELRTPLNAILGYSEMLLEEGAALPARAQEDLNHIHRSGRHLLFLIDDVLDIASIESGRVELDRKPIRLAALSPVLEGLITRNAEKNKNHYIVEVPDMLFVYADERKLIQALYHLLGNAFKFTQAGTVTLRAKRSGKDCQIEVIDTGIGMTAAQIENLFTPFWQADSSSTRRFGGSGLGLALVRNFIQMMDGTIEVESEPGKGSCFRITLPIAQEKDN